MTPDIWFWCVEGLLGFMAAALVMQFLSSDDHKKKKRSSKPR